MVGSCSLWVVDSKDACLSKSVERTVVGVEYVSIFVQLRSAVATEIRTQTREEEPLFIHMVTRAFGDPQQRRRFRLRAVLLCLGTMFRYF